MKELIEIQAPTTQVARDKATEIRLLLETHRKVSDEVSGVKSLREVESGKLKKSIELVSNILDRVKALENTEKSLIALIPIIGNEIGDFINAGKHHIQSVSKSVEDSLSLYKSLEEKINKADSELKNILRTQNDLRKEIVRENDAISVKKSDLNIYEQRLRTKWKEVFPETEIIL